MKAIERMRKLLNSLPKSDITLGEQFIQSRDFESLKDLVDSAIYKTRKNIKSENPKQEYLDVDLTELSNLKAEVDVYLTQLEVPSNEWEEDIEEEYYDEEYQRTILECNRGRVQERPCNQLLYIIKI